MARSCASCLHCRWLKTPKVQRGGIKIYGYCCRYGSARKIRTTGACCRWFKDKE